MDQAVAVGIQEEDDYLLYPAHLPNTAVDVTVVVPTYNGLATLARAVDSVRRQSLLELEIIVVDDASTDRSWAYLQEIARADRRVRVLRHKVNAGKPVGMNRATALARGRWLAVLDADDWYHPDRLARLVALGERHGVDMASDNQFFFDGIANKVVGTAWPAGIGEWRLSFDRFLAGSDAYETFNLGMLKPVLRTDFIRRTELLYEAGARHGQDFFYMVRFFCTGGTAIVTDTPYYYYTQPFGAVSRQWSHTARKRYDFKTAYEINRRYLAESRDILTPLQAAYLQRRTARLHSLEYYYRVKERLAGGDPLGAVLLASGHPAIFGYAARRAYARLAQRGQR